MKKILIIDDLDINREILAAIFQEQFEIDEAENGAIAIDMLAEKADQYSLLLLDFLMPEKSGLDVLEYMKEQDLIDKIPTIMVTGESTSDVDVQAYEYGAADIIYKPFSRKVVMRRALNIIELYEQRLDIEKKLEERTEDLRKTMEMVNQSNDFLIRAMASILELRSVESGEHIHRVQSFTKILLETWRDLYPESGFSDYDIDLMVGASALHDIGKIAIKDEILCKPGKLTPEEYDIMRKHTILGCELIEKFKQEDSDFYRYCYDICRYHHERYDGNGYPDGIKGDEIPIWAQVVAIADVYDALVSPRVYKEPYDITTAYKMIHNGECGAFNPKIIKCIDSAKFEILEAGAKNGYMAKA